MLRPHLRIHPSLKSLYEEPVVSRQPVRVCNSASGDARARYQSGRILLYWFSLCSLDLLALSLHAKQDELQPCLQRFSESRLSGSLLRMTMLWQLQECLFHVGEFRVSSLGLNFPFQFCKWPCACLHALFFVNRGFCFGSKLGRFFGYRFLH